VSDTWTIIATAAFGLEAVVARELKALGYDPVTVEDGRVRFQGGPRDVCRANLWLRSADRVQVLLGEFEALDFGALFDQTTELPWEAWLTATSRFPVRGRSVRSQLHSVPDCQSIVKKAIVERLKRFTNTVWFEETGPEVGVEVQLLRDRASLVLDTSGSGLHKRGYRQLTGEAPLKETLAAGLVQLSYWNRDRLLVDPCCGSATILIEAALLGRRMAPGLQRAFASEQWPTVPATFWNDARTEARDLALPPLSERLAGYDIASPPLELARAAARSAGVADDIHLQQRPLSEFRSRQTHACLITNPPYGERLGETKTAEDLYRTLGEVCRELPTWSIYVLTSHPRFEQFFGRRAERRRKLFNGRIECAYCQYPGPKPPRRSDSQPVSGTEVE
jgi:putative N6-adenine-specific DNA methylase